MELRDYLNVLRARKRVIILAALVVALTALVVSLVQPRVYEAQAEVLIAESDAGAALFGTVLPEFSSQPERGMQTQVQLMQLRPLVESTIRTLDLQISSQDLLAQVSVSAVGQTNVVEVTARAEDPVLAADIANTLAGEYVAWSQETDRESLRSASREVEARLEASRLEVLELGRRVAEEGKTDELEAELSIAIGAYTTLAEKLEQLKVSEELEAGAGLVVSPAVPDENYVEPTPVRNTAIGLLIGLALGLGMAFLNEYLDNTIKSAEELERIYGAPVLGMIPMTASPDGDHTLVIVQSPGSSAAEAYRGLRNSLDFINFDGEMRTLLVTSAAPAEGKSTVAANLAASLGQAGKRVVLVSTDFRRPTTHRFFSTSSVIGLSDVLLGSHSLKAALQRPGDESVLILTPGKMPPNPSELLASSKMQAVLEQLEEWADWIIIDSPPLLAVADPASVARYVDGVLLVAQAGVSTREAAQSAAQMLAQVGARMAGVVAWGLSGGKGKSGSAGFVSDYSQYSYSAYYAESVGGTADGVAAAASWVPQESLGRRTARSLGKIATGLLAFLLVIAVALAVVYFLDAYFGWGLLETASAMW
jgi:capsular exopolysaccharide synthesis family protein